MTLEKIARIGAIPTIVLGLGVLLYTDYQFNQHNEQETVLNRQEHSRIQKKYSVLGCLEKAYGAESVWLDNKGVYDCAVAEYSASESKDDFETWLFRKAHGGGQ